MIVTIIGTGLIGGSLAITLKERGFATKIIGVDLVQENLHKALRRKIIDKSAPLAEAIAAAELVILAIPVDAMLKLLPQVMDLVDQQTVMDVGSTKVAILQQIAHHPKRAQFVASHPMAGTECSGPESALPNLFDHKCTVICEVEKSSTKAHRLIKQLYQTLQMRLIYLNAAAHDMHTAYISHISHISSFALALTVLEKEDEEERILELASGGFSSTVRLARSNPKMWIPIFEQNRENILDVLDEHLKNLQQFRDLLANKDFENFARLIRKANNIQKILK
ncbi:MAG: prephenate dehydrogenase [Saprospiraceae bacterium]